MATRVFGGRFENASLPGTTCYAVELTSFSDPISGDKSMRHILCGVSFNDNFTQGILDAAPDHDTVHAGMIDNQAGVAAVEGAIRSTKVLLSASASDQVRLVQASSIMKVRDANDAVFATRIWPRKRGFRMSGQSFGTSAPLSFDVL